MLRGYKEKKKEEAILGTKNEETAFLDRCLDNIEPYERDILEKTLIENVSLRQYAKMSGFSRDSVTKQRQRVLKMLAKFFNMMANQKNN